MHCCPIAEVLTLITVANGAPVLARTFVGQRWSRPLDFGLLWFDRKRLLGSSKTVRGVLCSISTTIIAASILGLGWQRGLVVGCAAMGGDLLSSFIKRRMALAPSARATGIDQVPESLLPALVCKNSFGLNWLDVFAVTSAFFLGEIILSRILYRLRIRTRPY